MSTATTPPFGGWRMGYTVDRQFKVCSLCGGKVQVDTHSSPGDKEDSPAVLTEVEMHVGSCFPQPDPKATESYP